MKSFWSRRLSAAAASKEPCSTLVRPPRTFPDHAQGNARWLEFKSFDPLPAEQEQSWLHAVKRAEFVRAESLLGPNSRAIVWHRTPEMHVLRLPLTLPGSEMLGGQFLFVRDSALELIKLVRSLPVACAVGNTGKSVFQWTYLLALFRPDIYQALTGEPSFPPAPVLGSSTHPHSKNVIATTTEPPSTIVHVQRGGARAFVYLLEDEQVFEVRREVPAAVNMFKAPHHLLIWEPTSAAGEITFDELDGGMQILAVVSPDNLGHLGKRRDHHFCYMPCPSSPELLGMARFLRERVRDENHLLGDELVRDRIRVFGPIVRHVLPSDHILHQRFT